MAVAIIVDVIGCVLCNYALIGRTVDRHHQIVFAGEDRIDFHTLHIAVFCKNGGCAVDYFIVDIRHIESG